MKNDYAMVWCKVCGGYTEHYGKLSPMERCMRHEKLEAKMMETITTKLAKEIAGYGKTE